MDRAQYNSCMVPYMRGAGKTKEQRQMGMCIGAKLCTGKAKTEAEAKEICSRPKEPKVKTAATVSDMPTKKRKSPKNAMIICKNLGIEEADCILKSLEKSGMTITDDFRNTVVNATVECQCQR